MKNKLVRLICVLAIILISTGLAGCSIGMDSLDDIIEKNDLTAQITYYANGGWFNNDAASISRDLYYKENSKALEITDTTQTKIKHSKHLYAGWYTIETVKISDESYFVCDVTAEEAATYLIGESAAVTYNNGQYVIKISDYEKLVETAKVPMLMLDQPFDFSGKTLKKGDKLYLAAKWIPNQKVEYVLITEDCDSITVLNDDGTTADFNDGDVVGSEIFDNNGVYRVPTEYTLPPVVVDGATFVDYYVYSDDADRDNLVRLSDQTSTLTRPDDGTNIKVFVKYVAGTWKVVREAKDVPAMFNLTNKFYVANDVDCSEAAAFNIVGERFTGTIRGNGHTISGINAKRENMSNGDNVALFGAMTGSAVLKDITFEDVTVNCSSRPNASVNIYLVAYAWDENAQPTISNVKFDGLTLSVKLAATNPGLINNMSYNGTTYEADTLIASGFTNAQFLATYTTFSIENYLISVNNTTVATDITAA